MNLDFVCTQYLLPYMCNVYVYLCGLCGSRIENRNYILVVPTIYSCVRYCILIKLHTVSKSKPEICVSLKFEESPIEDKRSQVKPNYFYTIFIGEVHKLSKLYVFCCCNDAECSASTKRNFS